MKLIIVNFFGGSGVGKCLKKGTKILSFDGHFLPIENFKVGDLIMGPDSTPRKILKMFYGREKLYNIKLNNNINIETTGNHILSLKPCIKKDKRIFNISVIDFMNKSKKFQNETKMYFNSIDFDKKNILIDPYYLGLWLGDGHSDTYSRITNADDNIIKFLKNFSKNLPEKSELIKVGNSKYTYDIVRKIKKGEPELLKYFRTYNLINNKHIPMEYLINDRPTRLKILAGLIDSDGYLGNNETYYEIVTKFEQLSNDIKYLCQSLGFKINITIKHDKTYNKSYYRLTIIGNNLYEIPVLLDRKKVSNNKYRRINYSLLKILDIQQNFHDDEYVGLELDKDNLFITENFIVTHNSTTSAYLFSLLKMVGINCELVTEFAKDLTWDESRKVLTYQPYVFGQQAWRLERLRGKVDVVITDSPLLLSKIYCSPDMPQCWHDYVMWEHNKNPSINFLLKRNTKYNPIGRNETLTEAIEIDRKIEDSLREINLEIDEFLTGDGTAPIRAYAKVVSHSLVSPLLNEKEI